MPLRLCAGFPETQGEAAEKQTQTKTNGYLGAGGFLHEHVSHKWGDDDLHVQEQFAGSLYEVRVFMSFRRLCFLDFLVISSSRQPKAFSSFMSMPW